MYETLNDLSPSIRTRMIELLNVRLADAIDLRTQLKVAHWNVKGPGLQPEQAPQLDRRPDAGRVRQPSQDADSCFR
jgi:hypothetical protein